MSKIAYDPVKDRFANIIRRWRPLRTLFYRLLDLFFLRSWHVRRMVRRYGYLLDQQGDWKLLDAGSGFGQYDRFILESFENVKVVAVDVKDDYLKDCRRYFAEDIAFGRIDYYQRDLLETQWKPEFDMVICVDVLEHIEEDVKVMRNLQEALKPGGRFIMHSPSIHAEEDAGEDDTFVGEHARVGYSKDDLDQKMRKAGMEPVNIQYTYGRSGHRAWELIIKRPMLWFTKWKLWAAPLVLLYYIPMLPIGLILMARDLYAKNEWGTGILGVARKGKEA